MKQAKVPSDIEFKRLLAVVEQGRHAARNRAAIMLSFYAGLRVGEIAQLTWGDVMDQEGLVRDQIRLSSAITKGGHARAVPVAPKLAKELARYRVALLEGAGETSCGTTFGPERPLLMSQQGKGFSANVLAQVFGRLFREAGIVGGSSHSGRRWCLTRLAHSGISLKIIMALAGHRQPATTMRYVDVRPDLMKAAMETL
jgi:integrase/recombinase XerD